MRKRKRSEMNMEEKKPLKFHYDKDLRKNTDTRLQYLREQVERLKNIPQPEQRSPEWYSMRESMITASDWGTILGENKYSTKESVLLKKCGDNTPFPSNDAIRWGVKYEPVANMIYEYRNDTKVLEFGCIRHPMIPFLGASPDGITPDGVMLEIKCPTSREITGIPPSYYWCQVQGQLEVCELDRCDFMECKIKEYMTEEEYLLETCEKGVVVEYFRVSDTSYIYEYSPIGLSGYDLTLWKEEKEKKYQSEKNIIFSTFSYWYLFEISCIPIYRNQEWFQKVLPELEEFWNKILYYRVVGLDVLRDHIKKQKEEKKIAKEEAKASAPLAKSTSRKVTKKETVSMSMLDFVSAERISTPSIVKKEFEYNSDDDREMTSYSGSLFSDD